MVQPQAPRRVGPSTRARADDSGPLGLGGLAGLGVWRGRVWRGRVAVVARPVAGSGLAGSTNRATAVALPVVLVRGRRGAGAGGLALVRVLDPVRLLMRLAILVVVDLGADALPDSVVVPGCTRRVCVNVDGRVVNIGADLGFAALDDIGHALPQLQGIGASRGSHGNGRSAADGQ